VPLVNAKRSDGNRAETTLLNARIDAVDALRGFALAGIVVAHMIEQFIAAPRPAAAWIVESNLIDNVVNIASVLLVTGKFYSMFAILFGMSFAVMMQGAATRGEDFSWRFVWRLVILFGFGFLHALIYRGDILTLYTLIGAILPFFYRVPNRWLWALAILLFAGAGRFAFYFATGSASLLGYPLDPSTPEIIAYVKLLQTGSFMDVIYENFSHGFASKYDFVFGVFGRAYTTIGYFIVGLWLVRSGIVYDLASHARLFKRAFWTGLAGAIIFTVGMGVAFSQLPQPVDFATVPALLAITVYDFASISTTVCLMSGFLLLYLKSPHSWLRHFVPYGRVALTAYITQSMIGVVIFHGWGLGLLGRLHDWQTLLLAIVVIAVQTQLARWWLVRFRYGPLEWVWRCATWFRRVPLRRDPIPVTS
jgi:uncharacterized protein